MEIVALSGLPEQDDLFRRWHEVYSAAECHGRPWASPWQLEELRVDLASPNPRRDFRAWALLDGDEVVSAGQLGMPLLDNLWTCTVNVHTAPAVRRRGHASVMLDAVLDVARECGRNQIFAEVSYPYDGPPDGRGAAGPDFATSRGFTLALDDVCRVLELPASTEMLIDAVGAASPHHDGYRLESFSGPIPDAQVASYVRLDASLQTEAPTGDLELEPQVADVAAHRHSEELVAAQGRTLHHTVALDRQGEVVAYTTLAVSRHDPARGYQWGTLVATEHRGHRLGLAVKAANVLALQEAEPAVRALITWNARSNTHMVAVNDVLGFRPVERLGEFQLRL